MSARRRGADISHWRRLWLYVFVLLVFTFLLTPVFIVVPMSFSGSNYLEFPPQTWSLRWYQAYFGSREWIAATKVSMIAALLTVCLATPAGFAAAYFLRHSQTRFAKAVLPALLLPQVMPVILVAIGVFFLYIRLGLVDTLFGIVLAHTALAIPFVVMPILAGLRGFDERLEFAARNLGATRLQAIRDVTLPAVRPSVISGALFAFVTSLDEVVIGLFIAGGPNTVLTRRMFLSLRDQIDPTIAAISTVLIAVSIAAVVLFMLASQPTRRAKAAYDV